MSNYFDLLLVVVVVVVIVFFSSIKGPKFWILGTIGVPLPKGENICPGPIYTIISYKHFTPIGATVTEISVIGQRKNTATNIPFQTNVWRVTRSIKKG